MLDNLDTGVWSRPSGGDTLSPKAYNMVIGLVLFYGFALNALIVNLVDVSLVAAISPIVFFVAYFVLAMIGTWIFVSSDRPLISFLGYNLVALPFGFVVNLAVAGVDPDVVKEAMTMTAMVTAAMALLGYLYPAAFFKMRRALFWSLLVVVIVELVMVFLFSVHHDIMHIIVIAIMSGYIGYDFAKANAISKTLDNAIDSAANLYMSIVIVFLRFVRLFKR